MTEVLDLEFARLSAAFPTATATSLDFLFVAAIAYLVDRTAPRYLSVDAWTRQLELTVPVADPDTWNAAMPELKAALDFLTGDDWQFEFTRRDVRLFEPTRFKKQPVLASPDRVILFSGGLDSLAGAIEELASGRKVLLVGHHEGGAPSGLQGSLAASLNSVPAYRGNAELISLRARALPYGGDPEGLVVHLRDGERTQRARSLLFVGLGLLAANAFGAGVPLVIPENGFIAVNMPLTQSRIGSCSTRTTHPYFLSHISNVARQLGILNAIEFPYELSTKGEVLANSHDATTLAQLAPQSVSCAHSARRINWIRRHARNCGYCFPCLIRRASLHAAGADRPADYGLDVLNEREFPLGSKTASDLRAVLACLSDIRSRTDVVSRLERVGGIEPAKLSAHADTVWRGLGELRAWVSASGTADRQQYAGLA